MELEDTEFIRRFALIDVYRILETAIKYQKVIAKKSNHKIKYQNHKIKSGKTAQ